MGSHEPSSYLEDYEIIGEISRHGVSITYLAKCKRGRLRSRNIALKKLALVGTLDVASSASSAICSSDLIHQTLHHPGIASLYSVFSTPSARYHVLEFCSGGSLADFIRSKNSPRLLECELRGVAKTLIDALVYLKKELIVHRNLNPSDILLTGDYAIKVAGFDCAVRLPSLNSFSKVYSGSPEFPAPEMAAERPYDFSVDLWSLGCVLVTCLSGFGTTSSTHFLDPLNAIPKDTTNEGKALLSGLLQADPSNRISLAGLLSRPFFANPPFIPLGPSEEKSGSAVPRYPLRQSSLNLPLSSKGPPRRGGLSCGSVIHSPRSRQGRPASSDIRIRHLRNILRDDVDVGISYGPTRRVVSDPIPSTGNTFPFGLPDNHRPTNENTSLDFDPPWRHTITHTPWFEKNTTGRGNKDTPKVNDKTEDASRIPPDCNDIDQPPLINLPIGTTRPQPLSTALLNPHTHKSVHGHITILSSRSLLVDFRESQRRKHCPGDEILIISPGGKEIGVYSAPHLSLPACLAEPNSEYTIQTLPTRYWTQYNDAHHLIEQIKKRTPKMVLYTNKAKCTLMANSPQGDIELLFRPPPPTRRSGQSRNPESPTPTMRLRFSRDRQTLEIAEYLAGSLGGGEWTKRLLTPVDKNLGLIPLDSATLNAAQKEAISQASLFLRACESIEGLRESLDPISTAADCTTPLTAGDEQMVLPVTRKGCSGKTASPTAISNSLGIVKVSQRPRLSMAAILRDNSESGATSVTKTEAGPTSISPAARPKSLSSRLVNAMDLDTLPPWNRDEIEVTGIGHRVQTRFIPFVGWCIRYSSRVSQGGRYRIMFMDGIELDIDVDEEWAEYISPSGETTRKAVL